MVSIKRAVIFWYTFFLPLFPLFLHLKMSHPVVRALRDFRFMVVFYPHFFPSCCWVIASWSLVSLLLFFGCVISYVYLHQSLEVSGEKRGEMRGGM